MELKIEYIAVEDLKPYERNTRKHGEEDVEGIIKSIEKCGFNDPIGIWSDKNIIVEGHGRLMAAKQLGMETVPCIRLDHLDDKGRREYAILHNATAELSIWDKDFLAMELPELDLDDFNLDFGIDTDTDDDAEIVEDEAPEVDELDEQERIFKERMASGELSDDDEEYQAFLEKFEAKKTTDDCYTPDNIYNAVKKVVR